MVAFKRKKTDIKTMDRTMAPHSSLVQGHSGPLEVLHEYKKR